MTAKAVTSFKKRDAVTEQRSHLIMHRTIGLTDTIGLTH